MAWQGRASEVGIEGTARDGGGEMEVGWVQEGGLEEGTYPPDW